MFESQRQIYEYQLCLLSVKMKVKFPCRMKIEHMGSLVTGQSPPSDDNRFVFNQELILKDETNRDCFELTVNLLTDKGAKYIAAVIKLYKAELVRSEGERLVLSLSKCIDSEAFCEVKVDQVTAIKTGKSIAPYDRKSTLQREVPYRKEVPDIDLSPYRNNPTRILESKSEYQFPLHNNGLKHDWETKSKSRLLPPQTVYQKSKIAPRVNYAVQDPAPYNGFDLGQSGVVGREKAMEAEVYKQGYQKLKEKYKKEAEISKQELNKRLALENTQNNLKLEIMRLKLKSDEMEKSLAEKNNKIKQQQMQMSVLQQKEVDNGYLREDINKKEATIKILEDKVRSLSRSIEDMRDLATDRSNQEGTRIRQLHMEMESLKVRLESRQRQFEKDSKAKLQQLHAKDIQLISKKDQLDRERKTVSDLEKSLQNKGLQLQKLLQNERNSSKYKIDDHKSKIQKLEREIQKSEQERKDQSREFDQMKSNLIKLEYDKKILTQQLQSARSEFNETKIFRQKYNQVFRDNKSLIDEKNYIQRQLQKTIQSKEYNMNEINKQFQDQVEYYKRINRELDEKNKNIANKLIQVEGQLQLSRNQQDKLRRNLEASVKQAAQIKEKEKTARKALKAKQQQSLSIESEQATLKQKLKSIEQIYKLQVDKVREEGQKTRIQLENELDRVEELSQSNTQLTMELNRIKIKLQYSQQKNQKDSVNIKEKQSHIESLIKDYEEQVSTLDQTINNLRLVEKQQSIKIQRYEIDSIKAEERNQKAKKDIKVFEQRCNNYENILRTKTAENQSIVTERETISKKLQQSQNECNLLKSQNLNITNQRNKLQKMNELLQEQIKKAKEDIGKGTLIISQRQKGQQQLRNQIKQQKEQFAKLDLKFNTFKKQTDRYRQSLNDAIQKSLFTLLLSNKEEGRKSFEDLINKRSSSSDSSFNDFVNMIIAQSKEIKQVLSKQTEQIKQLQRENQRLHEEASLSSNKYQNVQSTLKRQLEELEHEMEQVLAQKQSESSNYTNIIAQLDERVKQLQMIEEELNTQIEELNFTINSLKMDYDAMNDQNTKKITNLKKLNGQLQEKVEYQLMTITQLDERCSLMEADIDNLQATIENQMEASHKKDKIIEELRDIKDHQETSLDQLKKQKKNLNERVSELELHLNTERQHKDKTRSLLEEEQSKANELKTFISNLMKQKQIAIKNELQRSEKLIQLEATYLELQKEFQLLKQESGRNFKALQQQKQQNKKLTVAVKEGENQRKQERAKHLKTQEKLRQKEKQLLNKDDLLKKSQQKSQKMTEKYKLQLKQLQEELELKNNSSLQASKDTNQRIIALQNQVHKKTSQINTLEAKMTEYEQQIYAEKEKSFRTQETLAKTKCQNEQLRLKITQMDANLNEIADESKDKQQKLFELSGKIYTLELKFESKEKQKLQFTENFNQEWINKYDAMCEQYEQRLELVQKERDYFKGLSDEKDRQISKVNHLVKIAQANEITVRKTFEEKVKKLQEQKLSLFSLKNSQIQRLIEQSKSLSENQKQKQAQLRRLTNELEVARKTITNLDLKSKEYDQKIKGINKVYQTQLEQLKKKDASSKAYRESVNTHQWNVERQIKKSLQNFIKNFLEVSDDKNSQKLIELVRSLEKGIMEILSAKPSEK